MTEPSTPAQGRPDSTLPGPLRAIRNIVFVGVVGGIALFVGAEACLRIGNALSRKMARPASVAPASPLNGKPWVEEFNREFDATRGLAWEPYVYFRRLPSYRGKYVNIDSAGHRVTPQPSTPATPAARVFFLGGSSMWGSFQRDDHTIPAEASRRLQEIAGPGNRIEVTNLAEQGWVNSQEMFELILQLRAGQRPDVVVFMDGINEPFATLQARRAGVPENERKRVADFAMGRKLDRTLSGHGLETDLRAIASLLKSAAQHTEIYSALASKQPYDNMAPISVDSATNATIHVYAENVKVVQALAAAYHFTPIFVWQPTLQSSDKKLTPFEQHLLRPDGKDVKDLLGEIYRLIPPRLDSVMARVDAEHFVDATHAFKDSSVPVFMDVISHNTEESVPFLVDTFWPKLSDAVRAALQRSGATVSPIVSRKVE